MSSVEVSEKNALEGTPENASEDRIGLARPSSRESPTSEKEHLHFVPRSDELPEYDDSQESESITGYNAALMRARVTLSSGEEKKLIRRIDWHLIPLLSIMYMLKSIDAVNVCLFFYLTETETISGMDAYDTLGLERAHYGSRDFSKYSHRASHEQESI